MIRFRDMKENQRKSSSNLEAIKQRSMEPSGYQRSNEAAEESRSKLISRESEDVDSDISYRTIDEAIVVKNMETGEIIHLRRPDGGFGWVSCWPTRS